MIAEMSRTGSAQSPLGSSRAATIAAENPLQDDVRQLIAELNAALLALTPPDSKWSVFFEKALAR